VKLTTHVHLVPILKVVELYPHYPVVFHDVVLNYLIPGITLPLPFTGSMLHLLDISTNFSTMAVFVLVDLPITMKPKTKEIFHYFIFTSF
jgi:hypothetical protein